MLSIQIWRYGIFKNHGVNLYYCLATEILSFGGYIMLKLIFAENEINLCSELFKVAVEFTAKKKFLCPSS